MAMSAVTAEGTKELMKAMESALSSQMEYISCTISYNHVTLLSTVHNLGILDEVQYNDEGVFVRGKVPLFLKEQINNRGLYNDEESNAAGGDDVDDFDYPKLDIIDNEDEKDEFDWSGLAKGRHSARREWDNAEGDSNSDSLFVSTEDCGIDASAAAEGSVGYRDSFSMLGGNRALTIPARRRKCATTVENKRKATQADGDEFNDTSKLLDFDAGDYYGTDSTTHAVIEGSED